jgi:hypothetical protein
MFQSPVGDDWQENATLDSAFDEPAPRNTNEPTTINSSITNRFFFKSIIFISSLNTDSLIHSSKCIGRISPGFARRESNEPVGVARVCSRDSGAGECGIDYTIFTVICFEDVATLTTREITVAGNDSTNVFEPDRPTIFSRG